MGQGTNIRRCVAGNYHTLTSDEVVEFRRRSDVPKLSIVNSVSVEPVDEESIRVYGKVFFSYLLLSSLELSDTQVQSLKCEPSSEPIHISAKEGRAL